MLTSYALQVDKLAVLRITKAEFDQMWDHIPVAQAKVRQFWGRPRALSKGAGGCGLHQGK